jgi:hypothetical protein
MLASPRIPKLSVQQSTTTTLYRGSRTRTPTACTEGASAHFTCKYPSEYISKIVCLGETKTIANNYYQERRRVQRSNQPTHV